MPRSTTKYRNVPERLPCVACARKHQSQREGRRCRLLALRERVGDIAHLRRQVRYRLEVQGQLICVYVADFVYEEDGDVIVEDCKGYRTEAYRLKRKLMQVLLGIAIRET